MALLGTSFTTSTQVLPLFLVLIGAGIALSASATNTLMAATGSRRNVYLGWLHMSFSAFSVIVPLVVSYIVAVYDWQTFYQLLFGLSLLILLSFRLVERSEGAPGTMVTAGFGLRGGGKALSRNFRIYLGVFFIVGVQGIVMSWSYIYAID